MRKITLLKFMLFAFIMLGSINIFGQNAWINEIHYDNDGTDVNEFVEVVIENASSYTLSDFSVILYNGNGGASYGTFTADNFTAGTTYGNYTVYYYYYSGIQNGAPDGVALAYQSTLIQFLSYEGSFAATDGAASGVTSTDIGVSEPGTTTVGYSLQLTGTGLQYSDFTWAEPATATPGVINNGQVFDTPIHSGNTNLADNSNNLFASNGKIIFNADKSLRVVVFNSVGQQIVNTLSAEGRNEISVPNAKGMYIVKVGTQKAKVIL